MNKNSKEMGLDSFVQTHRKSIRVFLKFLKILKVKRSFVDVAKKWRHGGTSLHNGDVMELLMIKPPEMRCE